MNVRRSGIRRVAQDYKLCLARYNKLCVSTSQNIYIKNNDSIRVSYMDFCSFSKTPCKDIHDNTQTYTTANLMFANQQTDLVCFSGCSTSSISCRRLLFSSCLSILAQPLEKDYNLCQALYIKTMCAQIASKTYIHMKNNERHIVGYIDSNDIMRRHPRSYTNIYDRRTSCSLITKQTSFVSLVPQVSPVALFLA